MNINNNNNNNNNNNSIITIKKTKNSNIIFNNNNNNNNNDNNNSNKNEILYNICSYLWFIDISKVICTSKSFITVCKNDLFHYELFNRLLYHMNRCRVDNNIINSSRRLSNDQLIYNNYNNSNNGNNYIRDINWEYLSRRITLWPTCIDSAIIRNFLEPRNIHICSR